MLVVRALDQLGYKIRQQDMETPVRRPGQWVLEGHGTTAVCTWEAAGNVAIEMGGKRLDVVALPASLDAASFEAAKVLESILDAIGPTDALDAFEDTAGRTIVLYAGGSDEPGPDASSRVHTVGNDPRTKLPAQIGFLPVSPWDIGSVERVSRALRWFSDSARFDAYPLRIEVSPEARDVIDSKAAAAWLETGEGGATLTVRRPPRDDEWDRLRLGPILDEAREARQKAHAAHDQVSNELNKAVRHGKGGKLNREKKKAYQQAVSTEQQRMLAIERLRDDLENKIEKTKALLVCPACGQAADPERDFEPRANGCFHCACQGCKMRWEMRVCKCAHRYAVMMRRRPDGRFVEPTSTARGWEDRVYGSDLLALPGRSVNGSWGFVCPRCGEVS